MNTPVTDKHIPMLNESVLFTDGYKIELVEIRSPYYVYELTKQGTVKKAIIANYDSRPNLAQIKTGQFI